MQKYLVIIFIILLFIPFGASATTVKIAKNTIELSSIDGSWTMPKAKRIADVILYPGANTDTCIFNDINGASVSNSPVTVPLKTDTDMRPQIYEGKGRAKYRLYLDFADTRTSLSAGAVIVIHTN